jgi:GNAT superfamily N-acetyltransferase
MIESTATKHVSKILARGFFDNPLMRWIYPDEATRNEALAAWFSFWAESYGSKALCFRLEGDLGATLWAEPHVDELDDSAQRGLVELIHRWNGDRTGTVLQGLMPLSQHPPQPYWYLNAIAIVPGTRARGLGAKLLEPMLLRADREGLPVYLESSDPRNLSFYERYDFDRVGDPILMPNGGPSAQPMLRQPKRQ